MIMSYDGSCHRVPSGCVVHDEGLTLNLSYHEWLKMSFHHSAFGAGIFSMRKPAKSAIIVSVGTEENRRSYWHLRCSVDLNNPHLPKDVGKTFLWQLPYTVASFLAMRLMHTNSPQTSETDLFQRHFPTRGVLNPREEGFIPVTHIADWSDRVFYMSVKPSQFDLPYIKEGRPTSPTNMDRGLASSSTSFNFDGLPDDACSQILDSVVKSVVGTYKKEDFATLMTLRLVCKTFHAEVTRQCKHWSESTLDSIMRSMKSRSIHDMNSSRDRIQSAGMNAMTIVRDSQQIDDFTYYRWRKIKQPGSLPRSRFVAKRNVESDCPHRKAIRKTSSSA